MRLMGIIGAQAVVILVDSASTQNFLDPHIAKIAKLKVCEGPQLQVKVANGEKLVSKGRCEESCVKIQGHKFPISFHLLTLGGCEMVLGV